MFAVTSADLQNHAFAMTSSFSLKLQLQVSNRGRIGHYMDSATAATIDS